MLLHYQPWMFYMHYYATLYYFWDLPINLEPSPSSCFFLVLEYRRKGISNGVETEQNQLEKLFLEGNLPDRLGPYVRR